MNKLVILENSKELTGGNYILILPQGHTVLWGHYCSSLGWAYRDLQYNNSRKQILDDLFGVDNWEFVHFGFDDWTNEEDFWKFVDEQGKDNVQIDLAKIDELKNHYKSIGGSY